ncbi:MAG: ATP-binding protein [Phycisphaerales bacterium]
MEKTHTLLQRQLKKYIGDIQNLPENFKDFLKAVNEAYLGFDFDREMLERSIDISSRELTQSISLLSSTLESTDEGILVVDLTGKITKYNQKFLKIWNIPENAEQSRDDKKLLDFITFNLVNAEEFFKKVNEIYSNPEENSFDTIEFKDGKILERFSYPQRIGNNTVGRVWNFRDVTNQKRIEEGMKKLNAELENANEELKNFVYIASHDLREPLRKITAFGQILEESLKGKMEKQDSENLNFMIDGASRLTKMIEGLLVYSRVSTQAQPTQEIDLNEIVKQIRDIELSVILEEKQVALEIPESLPWINVDAVQIRQLMQNLIANGIKYQPKDNKPKITISSRPADNGMVKIEVSDNGIGIAPQYQNKLFTMFKRLHTRSEYEGCGIGLAVCKKIVQRHNGQIGIESEAGKGSTFWFTVPAASIKSTVQIS